jgi:aspartyl protease family protein
VLHLKLKAAMLVLLSGVAGLTGPVKAQTVTLNGTMGSQHGLLVIDGQPHSVAVGSTVKGVRLVSLSANQAMVEVQGARRKLLVGAGPLKPSVPDGASTGEIVLTAGPGGHFRTIGQINGKAVQFMVDTGASLVAMSQAQADSLGIVYRDKPMGFAQTANGTVGVHMVTLDSVRIGGALVANVPAMILAAPMDHVLLGNSFLTRFQMRRENDVMRLEKR